VAQVLTFFIISLWNSSILVFKMVSSIFSFSYNDRPMFLAVSVIAIRFDKSIFVANSRRVELISVKVGLSSRAWESSSTALPTSETLLFRASPVASSVLDACVADGLLLW
jgi:hypothetical protein